MRAVSEPKYCPRVAASEDHQPQRIIAIVEVLGVVLPLLVNVIIPFSKSSELSSATSVKAVLSSVLETVGEILIGLGEFLTGL